MKTPLLFCLAASALQAQAPATVATGLLNPSKIAIAPGGSLLVTETGMAPNSGRISLVTPAGTRTTIIDGLPSGLAAPDLAPDGVNGVLLQGNTLYILNGEGDGFRAGTAPNTITPNPAAPSSPVLHSIMKLTLPTTVDALGNGFTLTAPNHSTLADNNPVTLTNSAGASATLEMVATFLGGIPDPVTVWRNSHPYGLAALPSRPDSLYVIDAGMNALYEVTLSTGRYRVLTHFAPFRNTTPGPPVSEAVPDSIRAYGSQLLVSFLRGFPFTPGGSQVAAVDPATGTPTPFIANLSSAIDVLSVDTGAARPVFYTLEYSGNYLAGAPGRVTRYDSVQGTVIADGLKSPTSLAYDPDSKSLYVSLRDSGTIVKIAVQ